MEKPTLNRDVHTRLLKSLEERFTEKSEILSFLAYIMRTYVVDRTIPFNLPLPREDAMTEQELAENPKLDFPRLIGQLKERTQVPELRFFSIEDGRVVLRVDNQKVTFGDKVTFEFAPVTKSSPASPAEKMAPGAAEKRNRPDEPPPSKVEEEALNDIMQRFKRLDLD